MEGALVGIVPLLDESAPTIAIKKRFLARPTSRASRDLLDALAAIGWRQEIIARLHSKISELEKTDFAPPPLVTGDDLTAAAAIIDYDLTFERFAELGRYQTSDDVARSARRRGNDQPYRARGIGRVRYRFGMKRCRCQRAARGHGRDREPLRSIAGTTPHVMRHLSMIRVRANILPHRQRSRTGARREMPSSRVIEWPYHALLPRATDCTARLLLPVQQILQPGKRIVRRGGPLAACIGTGSCVRVQIAPVLVLVAVEA